MAEFFALSALLHAGVLASAFGWMAFTPLDNVELFRSYDEFLETRIEREFER